MYLCVSVSMQLCISVAMQLCSSVAIYLCANVCVCFCNGDAAHRGCPMLSFAPPCPPTPPRNTRNPLAERGSHGARRPLRSGVWPRARGSRASSERHAQGPLHAGAGATAEARGGSGCHSTFKPTHVTQTLRPNSPHLPGA